MSKKQVDRIIENALVVTINKQMEIIEHGSIVIDSGKILDLGAKEEIKKKYDSDKIVNASNKIAMPGLINSHTHIAMSYFKGVADDYELHDWLQNYIWPIENTLLDKKFVYDASLHGMAELLLNGTTTFCDMYFYGYYTAIAAELIGIRAFVGEGVLDNSVDNNETVDKMIKYSINGAELYKDDERINFVISPHSIYTCNKEHLIQCAKAAAKHDLLLHIHVAESKKEFDDSIKNNGKSPFAYLNEIGFLDQNVIAAHGIWLREEDYRILKEKNTSVAVIPESNFKLTSGYVNVKKYFENKVNVCIGTDGSASNNDLSLFGEMDFLSKTQKLKENDPTFLKAEEIVKMATINGAKALKMEDKIGSLEVGKFADLILLDINQIDAQPLYSPYSHIVYTLSDHHVSDVYVQGSQVVKDRALIYASEEAIITRAKQYKEKILRVIK